jgi:rod shape-determining protein MreD
MVVLIFLPILGILVMLQTAVFSNLQVLYGTVDLVFLAIVAWSLQEKVKNAWIWAAAGGLMISLVSALPFFSYLAGYTIVALFAGFLKRRIWQIPVLAMFFMTAIGTILVQFLSLGVLLFLGTRLEWLDTINLVILPSILLNLLLALPVYLLVTDLANWVYPTESE